MDFALGPADEPLLFDFFVSSHMLENLRADH
jgi:hypothetical protein